MRKLLLRILRILAISYVALLVLLRVAESKFIFFPDLPDRLGGNWHPQTLPTLQDVWLTAHDGTKLHAWWIPAPNAKFTFLAFHGNASNIAARDYVYKFLGDLPANVLAVEYRGYGRSEGKPSEKEFYRDARTAYQFLLEKQNIRPESIVSYGQSLGTSVATDLASQVKVGGLVLEAPFTSISDMARHEFPYLPGVGLLAYGQMDTKSKIRNAQAPVLIVQCSSDPVIPPVLGQQVFAAAHEPKQLLSIPATCHEESSLLAPAKYKSALSAFLAKL